MIYSLTDQPPKIENSILVNGVYYDVGIPINKTDFEPFQRRKRADRKAIDKIDKMVIHHSGADRQDPTIMHQVLLDRGLGVHFAGEDDGRFWQFNDCIDMCYHARGVNLASVGVELCLFPLYDENPEYYNENRRLKTGNLPHGVRYEYVHGQRYNVFKMPKPQWRALARVYAGVWLALGHQRSDGFEGVFNVAPRFPRDKNMELPKKAIEFYSGHRGMVGHFHITEDKIGPLGFPWLPFENMVRGLYIEFRYNFTTQWIRYWKEKS